MGLTYSYAAMNELSKVATHEGVSDGFLIDYIREALKIADSISFIGKDGIKREFYHDDNWLSIKVNREVI